jgi:hypothetical protein
MLATGVGSGRRPPRGEDFAVDAEGNPTSPSPDFLESTTYQPAFGSPLGLVIAF